MSEWGRVSGATNSLEINLARRIILGWRARDGSISARGMFIIGMIYYVYLSLERIAQRALIFRGVRALGFRQKNPSTASVTNTNSYRILGKRIPKASASEINVFQTEHHDPFPAFQSHKHTAKVFLDWLGIDPYYRYVRFPTELYIY